MATVLPMRTAAEMALIERYHAEKATLPGAAEARAAAFARFEKAGLPGKRVESWHYTDLRNLMRTAGTPNDIEEVPTDKIEAFDGFTHIALINGRRWTSEAVMPAGVAISLLDDALRSGTVTLDRGMGQANDLVVDLNTAFVRNGLVISVSEGVEARLHLACVDVFREFAEVSDGPGSIASRIIVEVAPGASLALVESHTGPDGIAYQKNAVVELLIGDSAKVEHIRLNAGGDKALMLSTLAAKIGAEAELTSVNFTTGGEVSRHQSFITYAGENAKLRLNGATMLKGRQHCDNTLVVDHAVPHGESRELFRSVIDNEAQGVFQGKIIVRPHAQKTDGQMASNALLLSDEAAMSNKPELEIFADDVVCAHGATSGALDDSQLFYLMARGLPRVEAEALLVEAFVDEALDAINHDGVREALAARVSDWMRARKES